MRPTVFPELIQFKASEGTQEAVKAAAKEEEPSLNMSGKPFAPSSGAPIPHRHIPQPAVNSLPPVNSATRYPRTLALTLCLMRLVREGLKAFEGRQGNQP